VHQKERQVSCEVSVEVEEVVVFRITADLSGSSNSVIGMWRTFCGVFCVVEKAVGFFNAEGGI